MPGPPPFAAKDFDRVRLALRLMAGALCVAASVQFVNALLRQDVTTAVHGASMVPGLVCAVVTLRILRRGNLERAVLISCIAMLLLTVPATMVQYAGPIVFGGPILIFSLALPYVRGRNLTWLAVFTGAVELVILAISEFAPGPRVETGPIPAPALYTFFAALCAAVILVFLVLFSRRMAELRQDERQKANALAEASSLLSGLVVSSPQAIAVVDTRGTVRLWNPACEQLFGLTSKQAEHADLGSLLESDDRGLALVRRLLQGGRLASEEVSAGPRGGPRRQLEVSAAPLMAGGAVEGFVALASDIAERKKLESDLLQAQKLESVGLLASGVAHDLNNLLTIVMAEASLARANGPAAAISEGLAAIVDAAQRAAELCRRLLSLSRRQLVQPRAHDLRDVLAGLVPMLQRLVGTDITVHGVPALSPAVAKVDKGQFEQVLLNLTVNARDAMPDGGELFFTLDVSDDAVVLLVRDTGAGMPEEVRARALEPFFTTKGANQGTGLGLATVADIMRRVGGSVDLESKVGEGTLVRLRFPRVAAEAEEARPAVPPPAVNGKGKRVLLVDDEAGVRSVAERILVQAGYAVVALGAAQDALGLLESGAPADLLITDVVMPGVSGRALAEQSRRLRPALPVLFVSGFTSDERLASLLESGRAHFLAKPFTPAQLEAAVERAMVQAAPADAALR